MSSIQLVGAYGRLLACWLGYASKRLVNPPCRGSILGDSVHYRVMDIIGVFCGEASPASNVE